ncbi:MAG: hypothetical protein ACLFQK_10930 [Fibrobacterota bacterium]
MSGNNIKFIKKTVIFITILICCSSLFAEERKLKAEDYRWGFSFEPGAKWMSGDNVHPSLGVLCKIKERLSIILNFGSFFYTYTEKEYKSYCHWDSESSEDVCFIDTVEIDKDDDVLEAGFTFRLEFPRKVPYKSTKYEYDVDGRKFLSRNYYSPVRPYAQISIGNYAGIGGGVNYYFSEVFSVGIGVDFINNFEVEDKNSEGLVAPEVLITAAF